MAPDRMSAALEGLAPEDRALVELYLVRQLGDVEIAELLRVEVIRVTDRRQRAFDRLADAAGATSAEDRAELMQELRDRGAPPPEPADQPEGPAARQPLRLALVALALAAVVALVLALSGGGDDDDAPGPAAQPRAAAPTGPVALRPPAGGPARGSGRLTQDGERTRLSLDVRGLPDPGRDRYALWLYDSVTEARRLAGFPNGRFQADVPLPEGYERYRYLDISREAADSNPAHGGQSVLRVALARLRAPVR